jgi:hypothetical protein
LRKYHSSYPNLAISDGWGVQHGGFTFCIDPPSDGGTQDHHFDSDVDLQLNSGGCLKAPAAVTVRVTHTNTVGCARLYGTEMLQLDVAGGDLPPGMMIRQSPTKRSFGQLRVQPAQGGGYLMASFFDLWTELSLDGGQTWTLATNSTRMALTNNSPEVFSLTNHLPALDSRYRTTDVTSFCTNGICCTNGILLSNIVHSSFTANIPPPPLGSNTVHSFGSQVAFQISLDGGLTFTPQQAPGAVTVFVNHTRDIEGTQYFDTQMLQLDISGGTLPAGVRVRQSPSRPSIGKTHLRSVPGGFKLSSYFDIYTELSLDGGATWKPACCPEHMALDAPPTDYPSTIASLNPAGYWRLNETTQPPSQLTANNLGTLGPAANGTYLGGTPGVTGALAGSSDTAARFNGAVRVPNQPPFGVTAPFTVEAWLQATATTTGTPCPISCGTFGTNRSGWLIYQTASSWNLRMYNGVGANMAVSVNAGGAPVPNVWYHIAAVYDGGSAATLYVNGNPTTAALTSPFAPDLNGPLTLGMRSDNAFPWPGSVDEFVYYPMPLSGSEIQLHFQVGLNPVPPIPYDQLIESQNPLIYLRLDEPALPLAGNSGSLGGSANGTYEPLTLPGLPGVPLGGFGLGNFGCQFGGFGGYIDIPGTGLDLTGPVTVVAWVQAEPANGTFQTIVGKGDTSYRLDFDTLGHPRFADGQANPDVIGPMKIDDGQWHFLAGVYDGFANNHLYVDGLLAGSGPATAPIAGNPGDVWIGGAPDYGTGRLFHGLVDEVSIFPYALSAGQLQQVFAAASLAPTLQLSGDISLRNLGPQLQLVWCSGTLQMADDPAGPFTDMMGVSSPFTFTPVEARKFYRVKH